MDVDVALQVAASAKQPLLVNAERPLTVALVMGDRVWWTFEFAYRAVLKVP